MTKPYILDVCCGSRMIWWDKTDPRCKFTDIRSETCTLCDGRTISIRPDQIEDFRHLSFPENSFNLILFDPPHLIHAGKSSWLRSKYGILHNTWKDDIKQGFNECFRVLKPQGTLIFKWNEDQISVSDIIPLAPVKPLFGTRRGTGTIFLVYTKNS